MGRDDAASTSTSTEDDDHCLPRLSVVRQAGKRSTFWFHSTRRRRRLAEEEGGLRWSSEQPAQARPAGQQKGRNRSQTTPCTIQVRSSNGRKQRALVVSLLH